jgi:hypothetical protein
LVWESENPPFGPWSDEGKQADSQRDVEAEKRKGGSKETGKSESKKYSPRRHEEEKREESEEWLLMTSDFLLLRFLLRVFVPLW